MKKFNLKFALLCTVLSVPLISASAQAQSNAFVSFGKGCVRMLTDPFGSLARLGAQCYNPAVVKQTGNKIVGDCNLQNSVVYGNVTINCKSQVATVNGNNNKVNQNTKKPVVTASKKTGGTTASAGTAGKAPYTYTKNPDGTFTQNALQPDGTYLPVTQPKTEDQKQLKQDDPAVALKGPCKTDDGKDGVYIQGVCIENGKPYSFTKNGVTVNGTAGGGEPKKEVPLKDQDYADTSGFVSDHQKKLYGGDSADDKGNIVSTNSGSLTDKSNNLQKAAADRQTAKEDYSDTKANRREMVGENVATTTDGKFVYEKDGQYSTENAPGSRLVNSKDAGSLYEYKDENGNTKLTTSPGEEQAVAVGSKKYTSQDKKADKQDLKDQRNSEIKNADDLKSDNKISKSDKREAERADNGTSIRQDTDRSYGGKYGAAKTETTQLVNTGVKMITSMTSQIATNSATSQNSGVVNGIQQQGSAATQKAINNSQADMLENSAKANKTLGMATVVMSALQGTRIGAHLNSQGKVAQASAEGTSQLNSIIKNRTAVAEAEHNACRGNAAYNQATCEADYRNVMADITRQKQEEGNNIRINSKGEKDAQKNAAFNQGIETASTAAQAALILKQANDLKKAANAIRNQAVADTGTQFAFNPGAVQANPTPDLSAVTADPSTVVADDTVLPTDQAGTDLLNPNISDPGPGGPTAGQFNSAAPGTGGAGGAPALGSVGGTSAAKDDVKPETAAMTKGASGSYSAGEGAGSKFSRGSGGSGGVGMDSGFADLLKKFLPGGEEEKKQDDNLAFDSDRSPASDQAAVLGRNQNIFEAIHKRYQKKHTEGAIVFTGDQG